MNSCQVSFPVKIKERHLLLCSTECYAVFNYKALILNNFFKISQSIGKTQ